MGIYVICGRLIDASPALRGIIYRSIRRNGASTGRLDALHQLLWDFCDHSRGGVDGL